MECRNKKRKNVIVFLKILKRTVFALNIFRASVLIITAVMLVFGLFVKTVEKDGESDGASAAVTDTKERDYSDFASGEPLFSNGEITVSAKSAILCTDSGMLLYEKQADVPLPMASITKVMTAVVALEKLGVNDTEKTDALKREISVDGRAVGVEGSSVYLKSGERVTLEMLLYSLLLESANDAASAIAIAVSESEEEFVKAMNEKAADISMSSTVFKNPHGLSEDGHYTTARDYARLMAHAIENPVFTEIISAKKKIYPSADGEMTRVLTNHNRLLHTYQNMIGGKTGFTKLSGRTLVTAAEKDGTRLICVTINAPNDWDDHVLLFEKGFKSLKTEILTPESTRICIPVACGIKENVYCAPLESIRATVKPESKVTVKYFCPNILFAPIEGGKEVGRVEIYADGVKLAEAVLYTEEAVCDAPKEEKRSFFKKITGFFGKTEIKD